MIPFPTLLAYCPVLEGDEIYVYAPSRPGAWYMDHYVRHGDGRWHAESILIEGDSSCGDRIATSRGRLYSPATAEWFFRCGVDPATVAQIECSYPKGWGAIARWVTQADEQSWDRFSLWYGSDPACLREARS